MNVRTVGVAGSVVPSETIPECPPNHTDADQPCAWGMVGEPLSWEEGTLAETGVDPLLTALLALTLAVAGVALRFRRT